MTVTDLPRVRFNVQIDAGAKIKSLESMVWDDVPGFVVLTGPNGSGKTQLLTLLAHKLAQVDHSPLGNLGQVSVTVSGDSIGPETVVYIPSYWQPGGGGTVSIDQMVNIRQQLWNQLQPQNVQHDPNTRARARRIAKLVGVEELNQLRPEEFQRRLPDDFSYLLEEANITAGIAHVFAGYRLRLASELMNGASQDQAKTKLGPAPWDLMNEVFAEAEFPFRTRPPEGDLLQSIDFRLRALESDLSLHPNELSSGEQVILGVVTWLYRSTSFGDFPKLLVLDEPDAHLHPAMTRQLLDVLNNVLVKKHRVRVMLTTHSPSTVALAPEGSIFEMRRKDSNATTPRVAPAKSKADVVARLTSGLVVVSPGARQVLVEDEDDVTFYETVRDLLTNYGPGRDPRSIAATPPLTFVAASRGAGKDKVSGGCTVVRQWVDKLDQPPFVQIVRGIIDRDAGNTPTERIKVIGRYSIENYYLDPLVIFAALIDLGRAPVINGADTSVGSEHRIRESNVDVLQRIVDTICNQVASKLPTPTQADFAAQVVNFTSGVQLSYPGWVINRRGHDLLPLVQAVFGSPSSINPKSLGKAFQRLRMVPNELAQLLLELQS